MECLGLQPARIPGTFGLVADPHAVPDLWGLLGMLKDALDELSAQAGG